MAIDDDFRTIATAQGYKFLIGEREQINLLFKENDVAEEVGFYMEPPQVRIIPGKFGGVEGREWIVHFILCKKSAFDAGTPDEDGADYIEEKYLENVEPLYSELEIVTGQIGCLDYEISEISAIPFFNLFDWNGDGLSVTCKAKQTG